MKEWTIQSLFSLDKSLAGSYLEVLDYPWEALPYIGGWILALGAGLPREAFDQLAEDIWVAKSAKVAPSAHLSGPLIIDSEAEVRHCAFIRGNALVGKKAVVGNSTELKNCILFDRVQVPHYNYVGDSILGYAAHMGAGAITSNIKSDKSKVVIGGSMDTGLIKVGAMVGDGVEVGCNSVLNPGTVLGAGAVVYPTSCVRGWVPADSIFKSMDHIVKKQ